MKQHEAVIEVMKANGGYATLGLLYRGVLQVPGVEWKSKTPFASIRRIVQVYDQFFKIRPGVWALEAYRDRLPSELLSPSDSIKPAVIEFNHSFYQGLLLEFGNLRNFTTYVPAQDKNRNFYEKKLIDVATLKTMHRFTYPDIVPRVQYIDVIWFNDRKMPHSVYEVEHSTDMRDALLKFVELQDFYTDFFIVADEVRKTHFERSIAFEAFKPIQKRVKFLSYESLTTLYEKSVELDLLHRKFGI